MGRIRTIKPEFNKSESVARLSESAQLFMLKILTEVDDQGRIAWLPRTILGNLYPFDESKDAAFLDRVVRELESEGIFVRYEVDGKLYAHFPKWDAHQVVKNPSKPKCPEPLGSVSVASTDSKQPVSEDTPETLTTSSVESPETLTTSSSLEEGNGNREMGSKKRGGECEGKPPGLQDSALPVPVVAVPLVCEPGSDPPWWENDAGTAAKLARFVDSVRLSGGKKPVWNPVSEASWRKLGHKIDGLDPGEDLDLLLEKFAEFHSTRLKQPYKDPCLALRDWVAKREADWIRLAKARAGSRPKTMALVETAYKAAGL